MDCPTPITIFKGDDSGAFGIRTIVIKVDTGVSLANAKARFTLLSYTKEYTVEETATKQFAIVLSSSVTKQFPLGVIYGSLVVIDQDESRLGQVLTFADRIPFNVVLPGYCNPPLYERGVITSGDATFTIEAAWSYDDLTDKPSINGVVLTGNKTSEQLGLASEVCYKSDDGFMFVPAGKATVDGTQTQVYRKMYFVTDPDMGVVLSISDHRYVHNTTTGGFDDIDE